MTSGDFTHQAKHYAAGRPSYPPGIPDDLLALTQAAPGDPVADIGAGTGLFTRLLSGRGLRVTAVEPTAEMRLHAPELPDVVWRAGTFEESGLETASQQWVVSAQAFHWADPPRALPEMHRILRPGRALTALRQHPVSEGNAVLQWAEECRRRLVPQGARGSGGEDWPTLLQSTGHFGGLVETQRSHVITNTRECYLEGLRSYHRLAEEAGPERMDAYIREVAGYLEREGIESFDVTWVCTAWTVWAR
ncbi:MAG TPA: class I SAM-dependent methyltransferase [Armatimonadota bacterium]|jgi:SAM-dependent methyltransferase